MPLRVALLGTGVIATPHATALRALPGVVDLVAVCDRDRAKGEAFQKQWSVPELFEDLDTMIARTKPDVVHVLLPPAAHAEAAKDCLNHGCHVFVEKPFCLTSEECEDVLRTAAANGRKVGVNHNLTFMSPILRMVEQIQNRRLGQVQHVTVMYNLPMPGLDAGMHSHWMFGKPERIILELGPHPLSVIYRLLGPVQSAATAVSGKRILNHGEAFYDTWQSSLVCARGTAQCVLAMGGQFLSTWVHVIGQDGEAFADIRRDTVRISENSRYPRADSLVDGYKNGRALLAQSRHNFIAQMKGSFGLRPPYEMQTFSVNSSVAAFYDALNQGKKLPVDGEDGMQVIRACETVIQTAFDFAGKGAVHIATH